MDENKTKIDDFNEAICEAKTNWLTKLGILIFDCNILYVHYIYITTNSFD